MIRNELDCVNNLLKSTIYEVKYQDLYLLCKKYYTDGLDYQQSKNNIIKFYNKYNVELGKKHFEYIDNIYTNVEKNNLQLEIINNIPISKKDIEILSSIEDEDMVKILLSLIFYVKLENYNKPKEFKNVWCNESLKKIFETSQIRKNKNYCITLLYRLRKNNIIDINKKVFSDIAIKVNHIDYKDDVEFLIRNQKDIYYSYLHYVGKGNIDKCDTCNRFFRNKNKKYYNCSKCR